MDATKFSRIAESLRQYRRAELKDFEADIAAADPLDALYVDPLHGEAVLNTMLSSNTTFISGRKARVRVPCSRRLNPGCECAKTFFRST